MTGRAILTWVVLAAIGFANGVLRDLTYGRLMSDQRAHQLSTVFGVVGVVVPAYLLMRGPAAGARDRVLLAIGGAWALTTVAIEFIFGHFVVKHSWEDLLQDWDVRTGHFWPAVPASILISPWLTKRLARRRDVLG